MDEFSQLRQYKNLHSRTRLLKISVNFRLPGRGSILKTLPGCHLFNQIEAFKKHIKQLEMLESEERQG